jgi:hypothetical protein
MAWQTPKTDWQVGDVPSTADFNRIEGNTQAIETGNRTVDQAQAPASNTGNLQQLLNWFANRINAIIGKGNWYDAPVKSLEDVGAVIDSMVAGPASAVSGNLAAFSGTTGKVIKDSGKKADDFMANTKHYGYTSYDFDLAGGKTEATRLIALGDTGYKHGIAVIRDIEKGILVFFGTDIEKALVTGYYEESNGTKLGSAWAWSDYLTDSFRGKNVAGRDIRIVSLRIVGPYIEVVFKNFAEDERNVDFGMWWEVW